MLKETKYKTGLLSAILLFLFIPVLQNIFHFKNIRPLKGAYVEVVNKGFSDTAWFEGSFQKNQEDFLNLYFGFHNYYIRLNNQLDYWLYKKSNTARVLVGKGDFLYTSEYIDAYYGNNFEGKNVLDERFKNIKTVQDLLASQGILLEVVFAPGKASFYPEFIPADWQTEKKLSNYEYALDACRKFNVRFIDFNAWFLQQKDLSPYDLYPKTGIHWSNYGALLAADSLRKDIEQQTRLNLRDIIINEIYFSDSLKDPDQDLYEDMNLFFKIPPLPMPYAKYAWGDDGNPVKPKALFIGDSYFWNIYYEGLTNNLFTDCKFWYYNNTVFPETEPVREVKKLDLSDVIKKQQVIVLMATESNIHVIGWGFIENMLELYKDEVKDAFRKKIYVNLIRESIKRDANWMKDIELKAKSNNVSIDQMITLDAVYIYKTDYASGEVAGILDETVKRIKNTPQWIADITRKAKEKNISVDEMIELDAKYIYDTELKRK